VAEDGYFYFFQFSQKFFSRGVYCKGGCEPTSYRKNQATNSVGKFGGFWLGSWFWSRLFGFLWGLFMKFATNRSTRAILIGTVPMLLAATLAVGGCRSSLSQQDPKVKAAMAAIQELETYVDSDASLEEYPEKVADARSALHKIPDATAPEVKALLQESLYAYKMALAYQGCDFETEDLWRWRCRGTLLRLTTKRFPAVENYVDEHKNPNNGSSQSFQLDKTKFIEFLWQVAANKRAEARKVWQS
jgi:hypothetical protein